MSAVLALQAAQEAGLHLQVDGDDLILKAAEPPAEWVIKLLKQNKAGVIGLLRGEDGIWAAQDWRAYYDERAGIAEHDGGLSREDAEAQAFSDCVAEWRDQNPLRSSREWCALCGRPDDVGEHLMPVGIEPKGPTWLHAACWEACVAEQRAHAVAALAEIGIVEGSAAYRS